MKIWILLLLIYFCISTSGFSCQPVFYRDWHNPYPPNPFDRGHCEQKGNRYGTKSHSDCIGKVEKIYDSKIKYYEAQCKKEGFKPQTDQYVNCVNEALEPDLKKIIETKK